MRLDSRFSYANVMSTLAVFLAIAGGSVAVAGVPADSVDSQAVIDETLKSRDLLNGEGVRSVDVENETLGSLDIEPDAVTDSEIGLNAVNGDEVAVDSLGSSDLAANAVTSSEIGLNAVGTGEIALDSVTGGDIAPAAVGTSEIFDNSVNANDIAPSAVGSAEVVDGSVGGAEIADGGVDASEIGDDGIYRVAGTAEQFEDTDAAQNADFGLEAVTANCDSPRDKNGELISGSAKWTDGDPEADSLVISEIRLNMDTDTVTVIGGNDTGAFRTLQAEAICLRY